MIIITQVFRKEMKGFSSDILDEILSLVQKHKRGLNTNLFVIQDLWTVLILKWYLQGKAVRIIIAKQIEGIYIPLEIYKKESRWWQNIRWDDFDTNGHMDRMERCLQNDEFETFEIQ